MAVGRGEIDAGGRFLAVFVGLALEGRLGKAFVVTCSPLGPLGMTLDGSSVYEAVALDPFGGAGMVLVVADVLLMG